MKAGRLAAFVSVIVLGAAALSTGSVSYALVVSGAPFLGPICTALQAASTSIRGGRKRPEARGDVVVPQKIMDRASLPDLVAGMPSVVDMSNLYAEAGFLQIADREWIIDADAAWPEVPSWFSIEPLGRPIAARRTPIRAPSP